jgi:hypothetical protein
VGPTSYLSLPIALEFAFTVRVRLIGNVDIAMKFENLDMVVAEAEAEAEARGQFRRRETWDVTFLAAGGLVRVQKLVQNEDGKIEHLVEISTSTENFFKMDWPPHIRGFKFQNDVLPPLLRKFQESFKKKTT